MTKKEQKHPKKDSLHEHVKNGAFNLEVAGETLIAVHNALAFTLSNRDLYAEEIESCPHCISAMGAVRRTIEQILQYAEIYDKNRNKLPN
jgi:hypothetical protein